jgi:alanine dehydrogenase
VTSSTTTRGGCHRRWRRDRRQASGQADLEGARTHRHVHSRRPQGHTALAERLTADLAKQVVVTDDWESCVRGADIVVEASRLPEPRPLLHAEWIRPGALVIPYGTMSAVELSLTDVMDKTVVDDETILLWHHGLSLSDVALGHALLVRAERIEVGRQLDF